MWGGSLLDYDQPIYLIARQADLDEAVRILHKIGMDKIAGYFDAVEVEAANLRSESIEQLTVNELQQKLAAGEVELVDVRGQSERLESRIEQASAHFLGKFFDEVNELDKQQPVAVHCRSGGRSIVAASIAKRAGIERVLNVVGGIQAWELAGLPTITDQSQTVTQL